MGARGFRRIALAAAALLLLLQGAPARAQEAFTIENYSIEVNVGIDNVYTVNETITVNFTEPRHGIMRDIPVRGTMGRESAQYGYVENSLHARVSDVKVQGAPYDVSREGDYTRIQIGDADRTVTGEQTYRISYRYALGNDRLPKFDEVYYNLIGTGWDTTVDKVDFQVTLPVDFDPDLVGFAAGTTGQRLTDAVDFAVAGRTIAGRTIRPLTNFEALTLRVELPQGTFVLPDYSWVASVLIGLIAALAALSLFLWWRFGRDDRLIRTVEFYPPDGMTPAEIGYIFDGNVDNRDVVSLLLYWADRGYLTITELEDGDYRFERRGELGPDAKRFETVMFRSLFASGDTVDLSSLKYTFYRTVETTRSLVGDSFAGKARRVFTVSSVLLEPVVTVLSALPVLATLFYGLYQGSGELESAAILAVLAGVLVLAPIYLGIHTLRRWRIAGRVVRMVLILLSAVLGAVALGVFGYSMKETVGLPLVWTATLGTVVIALSAAFIRRRTAQGTAWLGRILGLRDFLQRAERDRIIELVDKNPSYFYNVLPYAYVLGVTDKWAKNFEGIALQPPNWYYGYGGNVFTPLIFAHSLNRSLYAMQATMAARPQNNGGHGGGGGGFTGGGFAGGGAGGGGGGSW